MLRWRLLVFAVVLAGVVTASIAQQSATETGVLQRRYTEGAASHYVMTGNNDGWQYTTKATDVVKRDGNGRYYEEIGWSDLISNAQQALTSASLALRQTVSLDDPSSYMKVPNLAAVQPLLIGPITDTLTIYSDLLLTMHAQACTARTDRLRTAHDSQLLGRRTTRPDRSGRGGFFPQGRRA